mgnify:CR=1 FL=1
MKIGGKAWRSIWLEPDGWSAGIIDQTRLPHEFVTLRLASVAGAEHAISSMQSRGAPLIGAVAAYGLCFAMREDASDISLNAAHARLLAARPTAVNLRWALDTMRAALASLPGAARVQAAYALAEKICDDDVAICESIGKHGLQLVEQEARRHRGRAVNILTHCNAGWLATVDWGTARAPVYMAHDAGINVHVWVDETRPRNQGAALTAWELGQHGVPHTIIADSAGGHVMQRGLVDMCIVGTDRTTASGDVCNKIGTYPKALAARDTGVPFYVALPSTSIDWEIEDGIAAIPIEQRAPEELTRISGRNAQGDMQDILIAAPGSRAANFAFDVTPARLVSGLITERGVCAASRAGLLSLFPERAA